MRNPLITSTGPRHAHLDGFDLHANVAVAANNREGLEQLARSRFGAKKRMRYQLPRAM